MSKKSRPVKRITVDPAFAPPEGTEDYFKLSKESLLFLSEDDEEIEFDDSEEELEDSGVDDFGPELTPPSFFEVTSQVFRRTESGQMVVDLIIEVEDVPGATEYEIRTAT